MTRRARGVLAGVLFVLALVAGVVAFDGPGLTGLTVLAFVLAMAGLWAVAPLLDEDELVHRGRVSLDAAAVIMDEQRAERRSRA